MHEESPQLEDQDLTQAVSSQLSVSKQIGNPVNAKRVLGMVQTVLKTMIQDPVIERRFVSMAARALEYNRELQQCDELSFVLALMQCCELSIMPGPTFGHAYLVPFADKTRQLKRVTLIPGYKGYIHCAYRSKLVLSLRAVPVYPGDEFYWEEGDRPRIVHKPAGFIAGAELTHVYAVCQITPQTRGVAPGIVSRVLSRDEVESFRRRSRAAGSTYSPWNTDYTAMAMKTAIRRLSPFIPMSFELARAVEIDNRDHGEDVPRYALGTDKFLGGRTADAQQGSGEAPTALPDRTEPPVAAPAPPRTRMRQTVTQKPPETSTSHTVQPKPAPSPESELEPTHEAEQDPKTAPAGDTAGKLRKEVFDLWEELARKGGDPSSLVGDPGVMSEPALRKARTVLLSNMDMPE